MKKVGLAFWMLILLLFLGGCSDFDDQPGMAKAMATNTPSPAAPVAQPPMPTLTPTAVPSPTTESGGWVWVLTGIELNPEQKPIEVGKKGGSHTFFEVIAGGCGIDKVEIQEVTGTKIYDYKMDCSCDSPPAEIWPGDEYRLRITCKGDLRYAAEGNSWIQGQAAVSYYGVVNPAHKQFLQPYEQQLWFSPWHPNYDGTTSKEWVLFGPWGELRDEFGLVVQCGGDPCRTHLRYELQAKE